MAKTDDEKKLKDAEEEIKKLKKEIRRRQER